MKIEKFNFYALPIAFFFLLNSLFNFKMFTSQFLAQNEFYQPLGLGFRDAFEELKIKDILI